jgi:hypothetical protein
MFSSSILLNINTTDLIFIPAFFTDDVSWDLYVSTWDWSNRYITSKRERVYYQRILTPKSVLVKVGAMQPSFFTYFNEVFQYTPVKNAFEFIILLFNGLEFKENGTVREVLMKNSTHALAKYFSFRYYKYFAKHACNYLFKYFENKFNFLLILF